MMNISKLACSFVIDEIIDKQRIMQKYVCVVCNYIYDPEKGDPDSGIEPGTPFEEIPEDWVCPQCGATKSQFESMKQETGVA